MIKIWEKRDFRLNWNILESFSIIKSTYFTLQIKLEERPGMKVKVDRVNRLGKDVLEVIDGPSKKSVKEELQEFNDHWQSATASLESYDDKGYPEEGNDCCLIRIFKRKFKPTA